MYKAAQCTFPWRGWILTSESIPVCSIGKPHWQEVHPFAHDCYYLSEVSGELDKDSGWHGSVKPMSVVSDLLSRISASGQIIYEPFSGSGTTIIACENLQRKCRAIELSPGYVAVALERWATYTGKTPTRLHA
jgi:DNA modification methylase